MKNLIENMQKAVDIVNDSPHPTNKIAATIHGQDQDGRDYSLSFTNFWPDKILEKFGKGTRIGNSSGTIHAETACLLAAPLTLNASVFITDPFCPNCAKNMAEAGIKNIYIDHKGFKKDFAERRHESFQSMSMQICEKAGINVYEIWRKEQKIVPIFQAPEEFEPPEEKPLEILNVDFQDLDNPQNLKRFIKEQRFHDRMNNFAVALLRNDTGETYALVAEPHPAPGYTHYEDSNDIRTGQGKYSFVLEPVNRLLMNAPRRGVKLLDGKLYVSRIPTAREQVNLVGAGITSFYVGQPDNSRDDMALKARDALSKQNILTFHQF